MGTVIAVDVGVRNGPFKPFLAIPDVHIIGFEPDEEECERLRAAYPQHEFVPKALASGVPHPRTLWITENPESSSMFRPRQSLLGPLPGHRIVASRNVTTSTLDEELTVRPELLKIDVQGMELAVLAGSTRSLWSVELVIAEVEFNEVFEGQALFGEVDGFLRQKGFDLWDLRDFYYIEKQLYWADAWYVRPGSSGRHYATMLSEAQ